MIIISHLLVKGFKTASKSRPRQTRIPWIAAFSTLVFNHQTRTALLSSTVVSSSAIVHTVLVSVVLVSICCLKSVVSRPHDFD
jgi:hypothetical protein